MTKNTASGVTGLAPGLLPKYVYHKNFITMSCRMRISKVGPNFDFKFEDGFKDKPRFIYTYDFVAHVCICGFESLLAFLGP